MPIKKIVLQAGNELHQLMVEFRENIRASAESGAKKKTGKDDFQGSLAKEKGQKFDHLVTKLEPLKSNANKKELLFDISI